MVLFQDTVPLVITNNCADTIWPGIYTLTPGRGPNLGGFELDAGITRNLEVQPDWNGRVWGRTNCTFAQDGTPANKSMPACMTGDCGQLNCTVTGGPSTLAEFNLKGGIANNQNFVDISLVDGYNLPLGLIYQPSPSTSFIPPNLLNAACIATQGLLSDPPTRSGTIYTNSTFPIPWEPSQDTASVSRWCLWDNQIFPPYKPGYGIYPYPDDNIPRPDFDPCLSACSKTGSDADCCTGSHNSASTCGPSLYAQHAKRVCPDAYSYAYDDATSTIAPPMGGGWEVVFCPQGRSTDILATFADQIAELGATGKVSDGMRAALMSEAYINSHGLASAANGRGTIGWSGLLAVVFAASALLAL